MLDDFLGVFYCFSVVLAQGQLGLLAESYDTRDPRNVGVFFLLQSIQLGL